MPAIVSDVVAVVLFLLLATSRHTFHALAKV